MRESVIAVRNSEAVAAHAATSLRALRPRPLEKLAARLSSAARPLDATRPSKVQAVVATLRPSILFADLDTETFWPTSLLPSLGPFGVTKRTPLTNKFPRPCYLARGRNGRRSRQLPAAT